MATDVVERWQTPEIIEAMEELKKLSNDRGWRERYNDREKALRDYISMMAERYEDGWEKGLEKGREEEKQEVALRLLEMGLSLEQIAQATGIPMEEIANLPTQEVGDPLTPPTPQKG